MRSSGRSVGGMFRALRSLRTLCTLWEQEVPGSNPGAPTHSPVVSSRYARRLVPRLRFVIKSRRPDYSQVLPDFPASI